MRKVFKKNDLKIGMVVEDRNGRLYMVMPCKDKNFPIVLVDDTSEYMDLSSYDDNLLMKEGYSYELDIVKVYGFSNNGYNATRIVTFDRELLWERGNLKNTPEPVEMTIDEIVKKLGYPIKIVG